jgi:hypothetical protein
MFISINTVSLKCILCDFHFINDYEVLKKEKKINLYVDIIVLYMQIIISIKNFYIYFSKVAFLFVSL